PRAQDRTQTRDPPHSQAARSYRSRPPPATQAPDSNPRGRWKSTPRAPPARYVDRAGQGESQDLTWPRAEAREPSESSQPPSSLTNARQSGRTGPREGPPHCIPRPTDLPRRCHLGPGIPTEATRDVREQTRVVQFTAREAHRDAHHTHLSHRHLKAEAH